MRTPNEPMTPEEVEDVRRCVGEATRSGARLLKRILATLDAANKRIAELEAELDRQYDVIHGMHGEYQQIWLEKDKRIAELERLVAAWKAYAIAEDTDAEIIARQVLTRFGEPAEFPLGESSKQLAIARAQTLNVGGEEK